MSLGEGERFWIMGKKSSNILCMSLGEGDKFFLFHLVDYLVGGPFIDTFLSVDG